jgi:hypothetical protein
MAVTGPLGCRRYGMASLLWLATLARADDNLPACLSDGPPDRAPRHLQSNAPRAAPGILGRAIGSLILSSADGRGANGLR